MIFADPSFLFIAMFLDKGGPMDRNAARAQVLHQTKLFATLDDESLSWLAARAEEQRLAAGEMLFLSGEAAAGMFVVVSGTVRAFQQNTDGREQVIHVDQAGSAIADVVVFDDGPYPASAVAETDAEVLFLRKEDVRQLCLKYPDFSLGALKLMAQRVRKHAQLVNVLSLHEVGQRLAFLLLSEAERAGLQPKGRIDFRLSLSNHEIATRIGTVRDVVSRAFARLQHQQTGSFGQPDRNVRIADNPLGTPKLITRVAETTGST